jgi:potassium-transporting ATPase KdpC subunit
MRGVFLPALRVALVTWVLCGLAYPLAVTGLAQLVFPWQANGSLVEKDGKVIGSTLIGQNFTSAKYFHGRPSATTEPDPKDRSKRCRRPTLPTIPAARTSARPTRD